MRKLAAALTLTVASLVFAPAHASPVAPGAMTSAVGELGGVEAVHCTPKKRHHIPTWNYQAVHAKGILHWKDGDFLLALLAMLTEKFENDPHSPSLVSKMHNSYVRELMKAIIAFEIEITSLDHVFKLSQNRNKKSYENIIEQLENYDEDAKAVASIMKERKGRVFPDNNLLP